MSAENICRLCLKSSPETVTIFSANIPDIIKTLTNIEVEENDGLPSVCCHSCLSDLYNANEIRNRIVESDRLLKSNKILPENPETHHNTTEENQVELFVKVPSENAQEDNNEKNTLSSEEEEEEDNIDATDYDDFEDAIDTLIKEATDDYMDDSEENEEKIVVDETYLESAENYSNPLSCDRYDSDNSQSSTEEKPKQVINLSRHSSSDDNFTEDEGTANLKNEELKQIDSDEDRILGERDFKILTDPSDIIEKDVSCNPPKYSCKICRITLEGGRVFLHRNKHMKAQCITCGIVTRSDNIRKHVLAHKTGPQICYMCGSYHKSIEGLRSHIFNYHKKRDFYKCDQCDLEFHLNSKLWDHKRRIHTGVRPYQCDLCGKAFFASNTLKRHKNLVHLNLRAHPCEFCKKSFSSRYALKTHRRQHTGELPYSCELCTDGFRQFVSLRTHMKSKHNIVMKPNKPGYTYTQQAKSKRRKEENEVGNSETV